MLSTNTFLLALALFTLVAGLGFALAQIRAVERAKTQRGDTVPAGDTSRDWEGHDQGSAGVRQRLG